MIYGEITVYAHNYIKYWSTWLLLHLMDSQRYRLRQNSRERRKICDNIETIEDILYKRSGYVD